jgi:hypothetical protein
MSRDEFARRQGRYVEQVEHYSRWVFRWSVAGGVVLSVVMAIVIIAAAENHWPFNAVAYTLGALAFVFPLAAALVHWKGRHERRLQQELGLLCANCRRALVDDSALVAYATGTCANCDWLVLSADESSESDGYVTFRELKQRARQLRGERIVLLVPALLFVVLAISVATYVLHSLHPLKLLWAIPVALVPAYLIVELCNLRWRQIVQKHRLVCPRCGEWLITLGGDIAVKSGTCEKCSEPVLQDETRPLK